MPVPPRTRGGGTGWPRASVLRRDQRPNPDVAEPDLQWVLTIAHPVHLERDVAAAAPLVVERRRRHAVDPRPDHRSAGHDPEPVPLAGPERTPRPRSVVQRVQPPASAFVVDPAGPPPARGIDL